MDRLTVFGFLMLIAAYIVLAMGIRTYLREATGSRKHGRIESWSGIDMESSNREVSLREVLLVIHTTFGVEFEAIDAHTNESLTDRMYVCDDGDDDAESEAVSDFYSVYCPKMGWVCVGQVWS